MASARETLLARVLTVLLAANTAAGARVYRSRTAAAPGNLGPTILVEPREESVGIGTTGTAYRSLSFSVSVAARGPVPDKLADPTCVSAHAALMADSTIGLAAGLEEIGSEWRFDEGDLDAVEVETLYRIPYSSLYTSIEALS